MEISFLFLLHVGMDSSSIFQWFWGRFAIRNRCKMRCEKELVTGSEKKRVQDRLETAPRGVKTLQDAPRPRSWSQLSPKRGPKINPKSIKIRAWEPPRPKTPQDPPQGCPREGKWHQNQKKKKRLILMPKICKKRPASRFVFQRFWVGKSEAQYQKKESIPSFFCSPKQSGARVGFLFPLFP